MTIPFHRANNPVLIHGLPAKTSPLPRGHIGIVPDNGNPPYTMTIEAIEREERLQTIVVAYEASAEAVFYKSLSDKKIPGLKNLSVYVNRLKNRQYPGSSNTHKAVIREVALELNDPHPPSESTLYRYYKQLKTHGTLLSVAPKRRRSPYSEEVMAIYKGVIDDKILKHNPTSTKEAFDEFEKRVKEELGEKILYPKKSTFFKNCKLISTELKIVKQQGRNAAKQHKRAAYRLHTFRRPLQRIEMDAVHLKLYLLDEDGNPIGPWVLFICFDCYSRSVLGYHLKLGSGESENDVIMAIADSVRAKPEMIFCDGRYVWSQRGVGENYFNDGGPAYTALLVAGLIASLSGIQTTVEAYAGYMKPFIERFFGTLRQQFMSKIPGYLGKRSDGNAFDFTGKKHACVTVREFESLLANYIVTKYHHAPHKGLDGRTPFEFWLKGTKAMGAIEVPDIEHIVLSNLTRQTRKIQAHKGVQIDNRFYNSRELQQLFDHIGDIKAANPDVEVIHSPLTPTKVTVCCKTTGSIVPAFLCTPYSDAEEDPSDQLRPLGANVAFSDAHPILLKARGDYAQLQKANIKAKKSRKMNCDEIAKKVGETDAHLQEKPDQNPVLDAPVETDNFDPSSSLSERDSELTQFSKSQVL